MAESLGRTMLEIEASIASLNFQLEQDKYPVEIRRFEDSVQLCTRLGFEKQILKALDTRRNSTLSQAALEVLAIIAYNQPVSRSFIEQIRGVDSSSIVSSLLEKALIEDAGRLDLPGKPIGFRTTDVFLRCFGLSSLSELPEISSSADT